MGNALCTAPRGCAAIEVDRLESLKGSQRGESERVPPAGACGLFRRRRPCWLLDPEHAAVPIGADFELKAAIGSGSYAVTRMAVERATGEHFAVKSIRKAPLTPDERRRVRRELECIYHVAGARLLGA
ncbi:hypothetical protein Rsub_09938 [Raphidocelis subcapitata]|uniref:Protein kinase domain-containing protein n=1 Tax=Raphidocelis subcapitata TaxID=307507 RepID=A0A2V0PIW0_9CHLO|nr:hypothetical protein Rsub_09938 [Raphidocelis subcapitata]|eukprot:GBF97247.1 hypothetical protein Rsub_09938 [Raphidocelis subcapitata]